MGRIGVAIPGKIALRESWQISIRSFFFSSCGRSLKLGRPRNRKVFHRFASARRRGWGALLRRWLGTQWTDRFPSVEYF